MTSTIESTPAVVLLLSSAELRPASVATRIRSIGQPLISCYTTAPSILSMGNALMAVAAELLYTYRIGPPGFARHGAEAIIETDLADRMRPR